ncbi:MAG: hypothetical protein K0Q66_8 [Chitinophagaceae bacterium]|nr:hypothetical protein [Chitinophagaceae bacterium]
MRSSKAGSEKGPPKLIHPKEVRSKTPAKYKRKPILMVSVEKFNPPKLVVDSTGEIKGRPTGVSWNACRQK